MKNTTFLLNFAFLGCAFLVLTAIKFLSPEPPAPVDEIGMKLYRPIFFGKSETEKKAIAKTDTKKVKEDSTSVKKEVSLVKEPIKEKTVIKPKVKTKDNPSDEAYFSNLLKTYKTEVQSKRKYRNDVVVRYYKHESDGAQADVLVDYGFYLHVRPVAKERFKTQNSNVIYYGHEFPESDLKLIAYLLVTNGIPIKRIQPFKDFDGWKKKSIEIGGSSSLDSRRTLTLANIRAFQAKQ